MKYKKKYLIIILIFILFLSNIKQSISSINVNLNIEGCNNNNICESLLTEDNLNCPNDCTTCNNNNVCELLKGETAEYCPSDCQTVATTTHHHSYTVVATTTVMAEGKILNLEIITGINYAIISWDTDVPAYGQISWGLEDSYDDGIIYDTNITKHHSITIENLSVNTKYFYQVTSILPEYYLATEFGNFTTLPIPKIEVIPSIYNLNSTSTDKEIILSWSNPKDDYFYGVKIVRSPFFFPGNPYEGKVIYDGRGTYVRDSDVSINQKYYYSAFSYNSDLKFSSGVNTENIINDSENFYIEETPQKVNKNTFSIKDFIFLENDLELPISSSTIKIYPFNDIKIIIDINKLPLQTKNLILKIQDDLNLSKTFFYSFNLDSTGSFFYTVIPNHLDKKIYSFSITSYGLDNKETSFLNGFFDVVTIKESKTVNINLINIVLVSLIIFILSLIIFLFLKNKIKKI